MKIERSAPARGARSAVAAAYARAAGTGVSPSELENVSPASVSPASVSPASVLGIPESEFTPRVRDAIMALMAEVDTLRHELTQARARLDEMEKTADQDQDLPLLNRRAFVRELTRNIATTGRYNTPTSLIYFDMNYLKRVNDSHGHAAGDAVLAHFAAVLAANTRDSDIVGRLGGDEFGVLLSHATYDQALKKADMLAESLRLSPTLWEGQTIAATFSYGAFEVKPGDNADSAMARADAAMYAQKRASRKAAE